MLRRVRGGVNRLHGVKIEEGISYFMGTVAEHFLSAISTSFVYIAAVNVRNVYHPV